MNGQRMPRIFAVVVTVATLTVGGVVVSPEADAKGMTLKQFFDTKSYPFPRYNGGNSPAGYSRGYCVDYAIWAWEHWAGVKFDHVRVSNFKTTARNRGYKVSTTPKKGALAVWTRGGTHMAYVYSYTPRAATFRVREVRWDKAGPAFRDIRRSDINKSRRAPNYFIYPK